MSLVSAISLGAAVQGRPERRSPSCPGTPAGLVVWAASSGQGLPASTVQDSVAILHTTALVDLTRDLRSMNPALAHRSWSIVPTCVTDIPMHGRSIPRPVSSFVRSVLIAARARARLFCVLGYDPVLLQELCRQKRFSTGHCGCFHLAPVSPSHPIIVCVRVCTHTCAALPL